MLGSNTENRAHDNASWLLELIGPSRQEALPLPVGPADFHDHPDHLRGDPDDPLNELPWVVRASHLAPPVSRTAGDVPRGQIG
jgi:hypothetical protein